jgi:hypothetical protein
VFLLMAIFAPLREIVFDLKSDAGGETGQASFKTGFPSPAR